MAQEVVALRAENNTVRRFFTDRLVHLYENMSARDVQTTEALRTILTLHRDEHRLNQHLREAMNRLEALLGQSLCQALDQDNPALPPLRTSPPSPHDNDNPSSPVGTGSAANASTPIQASNKRGTSSRPDDINGSAKRQKL